jgi:uncharacterized protein (DUF427 family)
MPPKDRDVPGPGQESVWDYPRPPRLEPVYGRVTVEVAGQLIADTTRAMRVLETSHPPTVYIPPDDVRTEFLVPNRQSSHCEWKGRASYADLVVEDAHIESATWYYEAPVAPFGELKGYYSFYPGRVDRCTIDGEVVEPQPGDFYGGWKTSKIVGPIKGGPGTMGW